MSDSGGVDVGDSPPSGPCPCSLTSTDVCEARLALGLAFPCPKFPSESPSECEPTEDIQCTKLLSIVCTYRLQLPDRQTDRQLPDSSQSALKTKTKQNKKCLEPLNKINTIGGQAVLTTSSPQFKP